MASITIKHSTIKFEKMDKKGMFVNASSAASTRAKIDKNYQDIVNAWKSIEKTFTNLEGKSSGKVKQMFLLSRSFIKKYTDLISVITLWWRGLMIFYGHLRRRKIQPAIRIR